MTYQELKEQISQQGTQCGVNLGMSSAVLTVDTEEHGYDEAAHIASVLAFAFGFSRDDIDKSGNSIYKDTFSELCKLLTELKLKNELPRIEFIYTDHETYVATWHITSIEYDKNSASDHCISWFFRDESMTASQYLFSERP